MIGVLILLIAAGVLLDYSLVDPIAGENIPKRKGITICIAINVISLGVLVAAYKGAKAATYHLDLETKRIIFNFSLMWFLSIVSIIKALLLKYATKLPIIKRTIVRIIANNFMLTLFFGIELVGAEFIYGIFRFGRG